MTMRARSDGRKKIYIKPPQAKEIGVAPALAILSKCS
jgi:hypothetical protein